MKWEEFLKKVDDLPVIETEVLLSGVVEPEPLRVQLSRWQKAGKIVQVKKDVYLFAESYRGKNIYEPYLASILKKPSYISLEKALEYHLEYHNNMIPEAVPVYTSVTPKRAGKFVSEIGTLQYYFTCCWDN